MTEPTSGRGLSPSRTVWVYDDPASGIEVHDGPGIGHKIEMPSDLYERFRRAEEEFRNVAGEVEDLLPSPWVSESASPSADDGAA